MSDPWLPGWLRVVWAVLLVTVAALHLGHVVVMSGQRRCWHAAHTAMAAGMAVMYLLPRMGHLGLYRAGLVLFVVAALALVVVTAESRRREGVVNPLWVASTLDMVIMVYMLLPSRLAALTGLFVVYLAGQTVAWALGLWSRVPLLSPVPVGGRGVAGSRSVAVGLTAASSAVVLGTLAVMSAGMAYMLVAM